MLLKIIISYFIFELCDSSLISSKERLQDNLKLTEIKENNFLDEIYTQWKNFSSVNASDVLESLRSLEFDSETSHWESADKIIEEFNDRLIGSHAHRPFRKLIQDITRPHLLRLGYEEIESESSDEKSLRNLAKKWSCTAWDKNCLDNEYQKWWTFFTTGVTDNSIDYCFAMINLNENIFKEILVGITTNSSFSSRENYFDSLGCNQKENNLISLLNAATDFDNILTTSERLTLSRSIIKAGYVGLQAFLHYSDGKFHLIMEIDPTEIVNTMAQFALYTNTECATNSLILLATHLVEYEIITKDERGVISNTYKSRSVPWNKMNYESASEWLDSYVESAPSLQDTTPGSTSNLLPLKFLITLLILNIMLKHKFLY